MKNIEKIFSDSSESSLLVTGPDQMRALGERIAQHLESRDIIGLVGQLGAGKTHLVQGILKGLGAQDSGASPTFALVHEHHDTRIPVAHFDFYRMNTESDALSIGWDEYLQSPSILLIEWADRFDGALLPSDTIWICIQHQADPNTRLITCPQLLT